MKSQLNIQFFKQNKVYLFIMVVKNSNLSKYKKKIDDFFLKKTNKRRFLK